MDFNLKKTTDLLARTPILLKALLQNLDDEWISGNEGPETWSPFEVVVHLIHGEKTVWLPRVELLLSEKTDKTFEPFDRFGQQNANKNRSISALLDEFAIIRADYLAWLDAQKISEQDLEKTAIHPVFGIVTLQQLLAAWAVHDLNHVAQITRVMAKQYKSEVGPWAEFLRILA